MFRPQMAFYYFVKQAKLFAHMVRPKNRFQERVSDYNLYLFLPPNSVYLLVNICNFSGSRILGVTVAKDQMYALKLKGISVCFSMLKAALCGSYVNFGVFRLYGDEALDNALNTFVKLLLSIPQSDLLVSYLILVKKYF